MPFVPDSILDTTKKLLGIDADYKDFDTDVIIHINSAFGTLNQLGVGPINGFMIEDSSKLWTEYLSDNMKLNSVKTLVYLKVRQIFDPAGTGSLQTAMENQIKELEWRLMVVVEPGLKDFLTSGDAFMWTLEAPDVFPPEAKSGDLGVYLPTKDVWRKP